MTEKRLYTVIDKEEPRGQSVALNGIPCTARHCVSELNALHEENTHIKTTIQTMIKNERTQMGQSVLQQLWEQIQ